jgi:hypothetical protein
MAQEGPGCNSCNSDVTQSPTSTHSPAEERYPAREKAEDLILKCLAQSDTDLEPKIIAFRTGLSHSTVKGTVRRMVRKDLIIKTEFGYALVSNKVENALERDLQINGQKESLPRIHDVHLCLKKESIREALRNNPEIASMLFKFCYRGPACKNEGKAHIRSYKATPCPSPLQSQGLDQISVSRFLEKFFNPLDPDSLYQLWKVNGGNLEEYDWGYQEPFNSEVYRILVMLYGTGTVKVIISNSEHPFTYQGFRQCLDKIDGIFLAKTGVSFEEISDLFYFEKLHLNNDVIGDREYSGISKLNFTVKQMDSWLYRVYEKVLGDQLYIRNEACLEKGNYADHSLNAMMAMMDAGVTPRLVMAQGFKNTKDLGEVVKATQRLQNTVHETHETLKLAIDGISKTNRRVENLENVVDEIARTKSPVLGSGKIVQVKRDHPVKFEPEPKKVADGSGPDKELGPERAGAYLSKLKDAAQKKSSELSEAETAQLLEALKRNRKGASS